MRSLVLDIVGTLPRLRIAKPPEGAGLPVDAMLDPERAIEVVLPPGFPWAGGPAREGDCAAIAASLESEVVAWCARNGQHGKVERLDLRVGRAGPRDRAWE